MTVNDLKQETEFSVRVVCIFARSEDRKVPIKLIIIACIPAGMQMQSDKRVFAHFPNMSCL